MDQCVILVDNSNVFIGGQKYSACRKGVRQGECGDHEPADPSWRIDFGGLLECLAKGRKIHAALLAGSQPARSDQVWKAAEECGFEVFVHDREHREKAVDTELAVRGTELIVSAPEPMVLVLASGDLDFKPLVDVAHRRGWEVEMAAFTESFDPRGEMATTVDRVRPLDDVFERIGHCEFHWPRKPGKG